MPDGHPSADRLIQFDSAGVGTYVEAASGYTLGTEQSSTSGTAIDFTGIDAGTIRIIITFENVSLSGSDNLIVQIGDAGGFETSGYVSTGAVITAGGTAVASSTTSYAMRINGAGEIFSGTMELSLKDSSNFTWVSTHAGKRGTDGSLVGGGHKSLSAELTQVRITRSGSNTFDGGSINILTI